MFLFFLTFYQNINMNLLYNNIKCQYFLAIWNGDEIEI